MRKLALALALISGLTISDGFVSAQGPKEDCTPYDPGGLQLLPEAGGTWLLARADGARFRLLATRADAESALAIFKEHKAFCYIGRGNPLGRDFVMNYLR